MRWIRCRVSALLAALVALVVIVKFTLVLLASLVGLVVVAAALLAYLKREHWTKPAYRWVRDTSGRWNVTPWTPTDKTAS
jgi:hypothetical protein